MEPEMNLTPKCLLQIKQQYPDLSGKYKDIADYILASPEKIIRNKVKQIAIDCNCDDSLIIRFCQKIGYSGFSELKMSIAAEFMPVDIKGIEEEKHSEGSFGKVLNNFLNSNSKVMHDTASLLNETDVKRAVEQLSKASKIFLVGSGASGLVASDAQVKLLRLGYNAVYNHDTELSRMLCGLMSSEDVILAISFSGETSSICEIASMAKERGTPVISISNFPNSRLCTLSDIKLLTASDETVFRLGAMSSRMAQFLIIDFLIIYMALHNMDKSEENVLRTHRMIDKSKKASEKF